MSNTSTLQEQLNANEKEIVWCETLFYAIRGEYGKIDPELCVRNFSNIREIRDYFCRTNENYIDVQAKLASLKVERTTLLNRLSNTPNTPE